MTLSNHFRSPATGRNICGRQRGRAGGQPGQDLMLTDDWSLVSCRKCDRHRRLRGEDTFPVAIFEREWQRLGRVIAEAIASGALDGDEAIESIKDARWDVRGARNEAARLARTLAEPAEAKRNPQTLGKKPASVLRLVREES